MQGTDGCASCRTVVPVLRSFRFQDKETLSELRNCIFKTEFSVLAPLILNNGKVCLFRSSGICPMNVCSSSQMRLNVTVLRAEVPQPQGM